MKRLTAVTAVLAGVGAAAGLFGMSEASSSIGLPAPLGFWFVVGVLALIGLSVYLYFRRIDWISSTRALAPERERGRDDPAATGARDDAGAGKHLSSCAEAHAWTGQGRMAAPRRPAQ